MSIRDELIDRDTYRSDVAVEEILRLEREVVEAALAYHEIVKRTNEESWREAIKRGLGYYEARRKLDRACDALLAVRAGNDKPNQGERQ
jgi:hypothetical protein